MSQLLFFLSGCLVGVVIAMATGAIRGGSDLPSVKDDAGQRRRVDLDHDMREWAEHDKRAGWTIEDLSDPVFPPTQSRIDGIDQSNDQ